MLKLALVAALLALAAALSVDTVSYHQYQVWRLNVNTEAQRQMLVELLPRAHEYGLNFWTEPRPASPHVDVMVHPLEMAKFEASLRRFSITYSVMIDNVGEAVDASMQPAPVANGEDEWFSKYHTIAETVDWYTALVKSYPNLATLVKVGSTYEGRDIVAVKISSGGGGNRKAFWIDGGIHAREWIAPATVQYILNALLTGYGKKAEITAAVDSLDWYIVPQYNLDGINYTWTKDRMWRKTVQPNNGTKCIGTDPNRNWAFHWGEAGTTTDPCSEAYCGPSEASAIEVSSVAAFIAKTKTIHGYINFHAYSQLSMWPWGWTDAKDKDNDAQSKAGLALADALEKVHGTKFVSGPIATTIYPASGSTADYTYGLLGIKYSYGIELRDTGKYGFLLPANQIIPSGEETLAGVLAMATVIANDNTLHRE